MKILFLDQFSQMGGAQFVLRDLLAETVLRGWRAEAMLPGDGPLREFCTQVGIPVHPLPPMNYANGRKALSDAVRFAFDTGSAARLARRVTERFEPDLLYVSGPRLLPAVARMTEPVVFHSHSLLNKAYSRTIARLCLAGERRLVIACSRYVAEPFQGMRPRIIWNGCPDQGFVPRPRDTKRFHIALIGRIAPEKGQLDFVLAARKLATGRRDVRFSVIGSALFSREGYEGEVRAAAEGLPVGFQGWTNGVAEILHDVDVIAVPSGSIEATPRIIPEALSAGTPVVAYGVGGIPELLRHRETGILTDSPEPDSLAKAVAALLDDQNLMAALSYEGRREWEARFRAERCQKEICDLLDEMVGNQNHQRAALFDSETSALR